MWFSAITPNVYCRRGYCTVLHSLLLRYGKDRDAPKSLMITMPSRLRSAGGQLRLVRLELEPANHCGAQPPATHAAASLAIKVSAERSPGSKPGQARFS
ncbi:hypothetical protein ACP4OV_010525 [Aristida adscensionis]